MAIAQQTNREYETIYILRPEVSVAAARKVAARMEEVTEREQGKLTLVESWGRRTLSYPVRKARRGVYIYFKYVGGGALVNELERNLRMFDEVLKYQTVLVRKGVETAALAVTEEDVKFADVEPLAEGEPEESREAILGIEFSRMSARRVDEDERRDEEEVLGADDDGDGPLHAGNRREAESK
jgi:small subunit ribosomal protein S6